VKEGKQDVFPVYENFTLFEAADRGEAMKKATQYAKEYVEIDDQLQLNGEPAYWKFEGIRKIIEIRNHLSDELDTENPSSGVEVSYSYMEVTGEELVKDLAKGKAVDIRYVDMADDE
jgi:hypothetical protein